MRLPDTDGKLATNHLPDTWDVIARIAATLGLNDRELADMLQLTDRDFERFQKSRKHLPATKVFSLAERLDVGFGLIVTGKIEYQALAQHYFGNKNHLPERYEGAAYSKRRTPALILNYIERVFGWKERLNTLRNFQLNESVFVDLGASINFLFNSDLCDYLYRYKLDARRLSQIGIESFVATNPTVTSEFTDCRNIAEVYEKMVGDLIPKYYEKNFIYKLSRTGSDRCSLSAIPNPDMAEMLKLTTVGNPATAIVRGGVAAAFTTILKLPPAAVKQTKCIYEGDSEIRYEIDYSFPQHILSVERNNRLFDEASFYN